MSSIDLSSLVQQVEAAISDPRSTLASSDDLTLDAALADLREGYEDRRPTDVLNYWF